MRFSPQHSMVACLTLMRYSTLVAAEDKAQPLQSFLEAQSITVVYTSATPTGKSHGAFDTESSQVALAFDQVRDKCPTNCSDTGGDPRDWTVYHKTERLMWCDETMLLDFSLYNPLDDPETHMTIRSCTANLASTHTDSKVPVANSCPSPENQKHVNASLYLTSRGSRSNSGAAEETAKAAQQVEAFLAQSDAACNDAINFAISGSTTIGFYAGSQINGQGTALSMLNHFINYVRDEGMPETLVAQLCADTDRNSKYSMGIIATTNSDLITVQNSVKTWKDGKCLSNHDQAIPWQNITLLVPATKKDAAKSTQTPLPSSTAVKPLALTLPDPTPKPNPDGTCATHLVASDDTCWDIAASNSITTADIEKYNTETWGWMGCNDLQIGNYICLSTGDPPVPAPVANAVCGPQVNGTKAKPGTDLSLLNTCPLNACCDIWGQCGTTAEFCTKSNSSTGAPGNGCPRAKWMHLKLRHRYHLIQFTAKGVQKSRLF